MKGLESSMEKAVAPHSNTLAWKIPWMDEPGRLQSMGSQRVGHNWTTSLSLFLSRTGEGNGNPLQCSCLENPRDGGACLAAVCGVAQNRTRLKRLSSSRKQQLFQALVYIPKYFPYFVKGWPKSIWCWIKAKLQYKLHSKKARFVLKGKFFSNLWLYHIATHHVGILPLAHPLQMQALFLPHLGLFSEKLCILYTKDPLSLSFPMIQASWSTRRQNCRSKVRNLVLWLTFEKLLKAGYAFPPRLR